MQRERKRALTYSTTMHAVLAFFIFVGLPSFLNKPEITEPFAITVDVLPVAAVSNVRPSVDTPSEKEDEKKKEDKKEEEKKEDPKANPKEAPPTQKEDSTPAPPKVEEKKDAKEKKKEDKKEDKKKKEEDPLDAILKSLKPTTTPEKADPKPTPEKTEEGGSKSKNKSSNFDPNSPEALSVRDAIASQVYKCWNIPAGAKNAKELIVYVDVEYAEDGKPVKVALADESKSRYNSDSFYRAAADSAMRAVRVCSPLANMPPNTHHIWGDTVIRFDPTQAL